MTRFINVFILLGMLLGFLYSCAPEENHSSKTIDSKPGEVKFSSSDPELKLSWEWAKKTALSYVREGDAVGPWYEAALPGRDAFCMRDVSHQAGGAAVLGLDKQSKNMLFRFAENISESKDWCSFWEINKDNIPAPVDYKNDKDFWYNLPANFDVMDACFRMYFWTGDSSYISDPVFLNFYEKSVTAYIDRWNLRADSIMIRDRIMNLPSGATPENHHYYSNRGIPGYHEGAGGKMQVGIDLLAAQFAAYSWYYGIMAFNSQDAGARIEAEKIDSLIRQVLWDEERKSFKTIVYEDGSFEYSNNNPVYDLTHYLLHFNVIPPHETEMINSILDNYSANKENVLIEIGSHLPDIFFRHDRIEDGVFMLKYLTDSSTHRREYPENPFAVTGAFVSGLMGVNADAPSNYIITFSGILDPAEWAEIDKLPIMNNQIRLMHEGRHTSELENLSGESIVWQAYLEGNQEHWYINGSKINYTDAIIDWYGHELSTWTIEVTPGETIRISLFPPEPTKE